jgi:two-component system, LytTR family, sensor kinase
MHTNKKIYWLAQFLGWTGYYTLIYLAAYINRPEDLNSKLIGQLFFMTFISIGLTHLMRLFMIKKGWLNDKLVELVPKIVAISLVISISIHFSSMFYDAIVNKENSNVLELGRTIVSILAWSLLIISWNGIYFTFHFFQKLRQKELDNLVLEASKNEIELKNLRSQLNPHFLFNSLNSIRALTDINPTQAKTAITTLSSLLRKSLISGKHNLITLEEELEIVSNYLELERIRFEERLTTEWKLDPSINSFLIPPFLIQTLVENAIKHGISQQLEGGKIIIETKKTPTNVMIRITNTGTIGGNSETGIGISNTERRLAIQYNNKAHFSLIQENENVVAQIQFDHENN